MRVDPLADLDPVLIGEVPASVAGQRDLVGLDDLHVVGWNPVEADQLRQFGSPDSTASMTSRSQVASPGQALTTTPYSPTEARDSVRARSFQAWT